MFLDFYRKREFGLDISDFSVELLELKKIEGKLKVASYERERLEKDIVEDGRIIDKGKLADKIHKVIESAKPKRPSSNRVIVSLPESKTFIHIFELPASLRGKEIERAVNSEALKTIPFEEDEIYFDFRFGFSHKNAQEVFYVAAPKEIINSYIELFEFLELEPVAFDIESGSVARAISRVYPERGAILIADIGARTTNLTIWDEDLVKLSVTLNLGGYHFTKALSDKLKIIPERAEILKKEVGLNPEREKGEIMLILQKALQPLISNIRESIQFYQKKTKRKIKKIYLVGGSSLIPELVDYLSSNLGLKVEIADPWVGIDVGELMGLPWRTKDPALRMHPVLFTNVTGLALRGLDPNPEKAGINLLPRKEKKPWFEI